MMTSSRMALVAGVLTCSFFGMHSAGSAVVDFDRYYPPYDELVDFIDTISSPIVAVQDNIGFSDEGTPRAIRALRISDNPGVDEDEPGFLFIGDIHGNEPLGVRVTLELIELLTEAYATDSEVRDWVDAYEIWIIPVLNPYGYDHSERKNAPSTTDAFTSGVDLNRNFDFRWDGDVDIKPELTMPDEGIYMGPWAGSEPETQAIGDFVVLQRPAFGVTFHSGWEDEPNGIILRPWTVRDGVVPAPDADRLQAIAEAIADAVWESRGYVDAPATGTAGPIGQSNIYHYAETGMFDYMLETSEIKWNRDAYAFFYDVDLDDYTDSQNADLADAEAHVHDYLEGVKGLLRQFLFDTAPDFEFRGPGITGRVLDCLSGTSLPATVKVLELDNINGDTDVNGFDIVDDTDLDVDSDGIADIEFRIAEPLFGRHIRLLPQGTWTVDFEYDGYLPQRHTVSVLDPITGVALSKLDVDLDPGLDNDGDLLTDCVEINEHGTDPLVADTDGDGLQDGQEILLGTDPLSTDSDGDGLSDGDEVERGTDPLDTDSDDDGLSDGDEVERGTDPLDADSDEDGLSDGDEVERGTDPLDADSDDDGLSDGDEVERGTDPLDTDSDDDGLSDGDEVTVGTDPLDADSDDDGIPDGIDPDSIAAAVVGLPLDVFANSADPEGQRIAMLSLLGAIEVAIADSDVRRALILLENLRRKVDGCPAAVTPGETSGKNDWIVDCDAQRTIRGLIDILITNLGG